MCGHTKCSILLKFCSYVPISLETTSAKWFLSHRSHSVIPAYSSKMPKNHQALGLKTSATTAYRSADRTKHHYTNAQAHCTVLYLYHYHNGHVALSGVGEERGKEARRVHVHCITNLAMQKTGLAGQVKNP